MSAATALSDLIERSRALGADTRMTNYGGGNTSSKGTVIDPASGEEIEVVWVKGSGGDLRTLTVDGVACLRRDRYLSLERVYRGPAYEDEMVALADYCLHGRGGAVPSIDTSMHVLVDALHVDHLHPDAGLAIATAADGEQMTAEIFGGRVLWVPWRRPGFQLGLDIAHAQRNNPQAIGAILGGHGTTAWADTSDQCRENSEWIVRTAQEYLDSRGRPDPLGQIVPALVASTPVERRRRAAAIAPQLRALVSQDEQVLGHFHDGDDVLDFLARTRAEELAERGSCCPDHYLRTKVSPMFLRVDADASVEEIVSVARVEHARYRRSYVDYYRRHADAQTPPMRGADPRIVLIPGVGMFSFGRDATTARVAGEYFASSIAAMTGAESVSHYQPVPEREKFRIEYWALEEAKLARAPKPGLLAAQVTVIAGMDADVTTRIASTLADHGASVVAERPSSTATAGLDLTALTLHTVLTHGGVDAVVVGAAAESHAHEVLHAGVDPALMPTLVVLTGAGIDISIRVEEGIRVARVPLGTTDAATVAELVLAILGGALRGFARTTISAESVHR